MTQNQPSQFSIFAPAKINLFLHVTGKRSNGYHELQSLIAFANIGDEITISPADTYSLTLKGDAQDLDNDGNNIITKAAEKMGQAFSRELNFTITLQKNIPMGAGLGGGSSDAAATIKAILKFWNVKLPELELNDILLSLGADVPACYVGQPSMMEGIGEIITPLSRFTQTPAILVYPNVHCTTEDVFKSFSAPFTNKTSLPDTSNLHGFITQQKNDLTDTALTLFPEINDALEVIEQQDGCKFSRMSGSGSTCFGLFNTAEESEKAAKKIQKEKPDWWVRPVLLN